MRLPNDEMILKSFPSQIEYEMESNKNFYINILMKIPFFLHGSAFMMEVFPVHR